MSIMDRGDEMNTQSKNFVDMSLNKVQDEAVRDVFGGKKTINLQEKMCVDESEITIRLQCSDKKLNSKAFR